ncbi:glycoside hydrolase family 24 protein [Lelliottia wanjuensis]|uniref:glycoside hydrolase family 24 protein n=1 Tax=Lelliottia wanjuensis TaxID=3050585 RepID=UPI00254EF32D|nr:glycoside hydrolase family 104 protein [Lelliottia sp. V104_15]MDK9605831.1 glycoside hydrolase family 104 protein [Lelliottia sp. V104_15]
MNICFPARKENGTQYASVNEIMDCIGRESHGSWLAGTNTMWHGGIHLTPVTAPGSVLTADNADTAVPLQCMADGEIVAWRVNQDYLKGTYINMALQYSTGFLLVKSVCKPDPQQESTWLEFYTLYTGLAPLSAYPKRKTMTARTTVLRHPAGRYAGSTPADGVADIPPSHGSLNQGCRVIVLKEMPFRNHGEVQPFGLVKCLTDSGEATGEAFLVTLLPEYMTQDGEQYAALPGWMQHALSEGRFDSVVKPSAPVAIAAGDAVGFLQEETAPVGMGKTDTSHFSHIEVLSVDTRMPDFLRNPGKVTTGKKYIRVGLNKPVYIRNGDTFTRAKAMTEKDGEKLLERDKCNSYTAGGLTWYQISPHSWVNGDDVKEVEQFDLAGREFCALVEESDSDMKNSLREGWMRDTYSWLAERINPEKGMRQGMVSRYYRGMMDKLDTNHDGELSGRELFQAIHHPEMGVRKIVSRLAVKHDSEWFGGSSHHKWETFFQNYDPLRIKYMKQWCDTNEWMSQVPPFDKGQAVWHMHPVVFLDAINFSKLSLEEARVRAFMRMIRVCEGTSGEDGYERLFGGESFIKDYHKTFATHPQIKITRTNKKTGKTYVSSAAGAYQIMGYTWSDPATVAWREMYKINDFSPSSQDLLCVVILKNKVRNDALTMIIKDEIKDAIETSCSYEWASLPPGRHGQPIKSISECLSLYDRFLKEELNGLTDLHIKNGFLRGF